MRSMLLALAAALTLVGAADARGGHAHYSNAGGHYVGGRGSSHRGGHYVNRYTGNHYRHHR